MVVQWLRLRASTEGSAGSGPDRGTKIPHAAPCGKKKKKTTNDMYKDVKQTWDFMPG